MAKFIVISKFKNDNNKQSAKQPAKLTVKHKRVKIFRRYFLISLSINIILLGLGLFKFLNK